MNLIKKKSLGQHFLSDTSAISKIINSACIDTHTKVLEIGPGGGALTAQIYKAKPKKLILIEKDLRFYEKLLELYPEAEVINSDFTEFDISKLNVRDGGCFTVVGNLPYNVSTVILERLIEHRNVFPKMVLMFQKEVGDRILAKPNSSEYGRLNLLVEEFYEAKKSFVLKPGSFSPPPKVDSMVIEFDCLNKPKVDIKDRKIYENLLKLVFSQRRKMLRRSLRAMIEEDQLRLIQDETGISMDKRPQELNIQSFAKLANALS